MKVNTMKRRKRIVIWAILAVLAIILLAAGGYYLYMIGSPQYALSNMVKEVNQNGLTAVAPYLTGNALVAYQQAERVIRNPLMNLALSNSRIQQTVSALSNGAGNLEASYKDVRRGGNKASITLHVKARGNEGDIQLEMIRDGSWKIEDVSILVGSWIYNQ